MYSKTFQERKPFWLKYFRHIYWLITLTTKYDQSKNNCRFIQLREHDQGYINLSAKGAFVPDGKF